MYTDERRVVSMYNARTYTYYTFRWMVAENIVKNEREAAV